MTRAISPNPKMRTLRACEVFLKFVNFSLIDEFYDAKKLFSRFFAGNNFSKHQEVTGRSGPLDSIFQQLPVCFSDFRHRQGFQKFNNSRHLMTSHAWF